MSRWIALLIHPDDRFAESVARTLIHFTVYGSVVGALVVIALCLFR